MPGEGTRQTRERSGSTGFPVAVSTSVGPGGDRGNDLADGRARVHRSRMNFESEGRRVTRRLATLMVAGLVAIPVAAADRIERGEMAGYLLVPNEKVPATYNAGFSMYVAAWPLVKTYPGSRFQTGLFGTWMFAQLDAKPDFKLYSDIEGGLGWWRDTRFATETPKFIMGTRGGLCAHCHPAGTCKLDLP